MAQIKKDTSLRKAILQAAITGQLISSVVEPVETTGGESLPLAPKPSRSTNDSSELDHSLRFVGLSATPSAGDTPATPPETGKQLLDRIIEERNKKLLAEWEETLKKNPKAKKPAPVVASEIDEEEIPFEIPENWCWCRLGEISTYGDTKEKVGPNEITPDMWSLDLEDIEKDTGKIISTVLAKNRTIHGEKIKFYKGNILYSKLRPYLKKILVAPADGICTSEIVPFHLFGDIENKYFMFFLHSPYVDDLVNAVSYGVKMPRVGTETMTNLLVPLPPLAVQNAIVAKLEQVLPLVDAYENAVLQKEELKSTLSDKVKKAILQEAITGKLTESWRKQRAVVALRQAQGPQNETTESGKQLLDRIISERNAKALADWEEKVKKNAKAKKPVPVVASEIEEDEIPFEVPEGWCWCKLSDYLDIRDGTHDSPKFHNEGIPFVTSKNLNDGKLDFSECKYITEEDHKKFSARSFVEDGDILFAMIGSIGNPVMVKKDFDFSFKNMALFKRYSKDNTDMRYIYHYLCHIQTELKEIATGGVQSFIGLGTFREMLFPLPPLSEQEEIVKKVEALLPLCK